MYQQDIGCFKHQATTVKGRTVVDDEPSPTKIETLVGETNEDDVIINDVCCKGLLDTGSTVSLIGYSFFKRLNLELLPLQNIIHIECAGGETLKYIGYVEVEMSVPSIEGLEKMCVVIFSCCS